MRISLLATMVAVVFCNPASASTMSVDFIYSNTQGFTINGTGSYNSAAGITVGNITTYPLAVFHVATAGGNQGFGGLDVSYINDPRFSISIFADTGTFQKIGSDPWVPLDENINLWSLWWRHSLSQGAFISLNWNGATNIPGMHFVSASVPAAVVPLPAAIWLFGSGLAGLGFFRRAAGRVRIPLRAAIGS